MSSHEVIGREYEMRKMEDRIAVLTEIVQELVAAISELEGTPVDYRVARRLADAVKRASCAT